MTTLENHKTNGIPNHGFPNSWKVLSLENCMSAIIDYRGKTPVKTNFGVPLITAKIVKGGRINRIQEYIASESYEAWMRRGIPMPEDILMTTEAPLGEIAQLDSRKVALAQRLITLRGKRDFLDNNFLKFLMISNFVQDQLHARATGTTVLGIKQSELRKIDLVIPPLPEQKAIAHILGTLDDKIELNQQMNQTLEAMAQAIFKAWFVDFDPVRAKMAGQQPVGMDAATAALFPDSIEDSELGEIPKGWEVKPLPDIIEVNPRRILPKGAVAPYLDMKNMPTEGHRANVWIDREFGSGTKFINGDTLMARITPCLENGKTAYVDFLENEQVGWGSTEYLIFRPKSPLPSEFGYYLVRSEELKTFAIQNMTGSSGRQRTPANCFNNYLMPMPPDSIICKFGRIVAPFMKIVKANSEQSQTLSTLRDTLLPKLMSGEIRVAEAERLIADSV
jgi:type I restriction enzyme, S subunit